MFVRVDALRPESTHFSHIETFVGYTNTEQRMKYFAQGQSTVSPVESRTSDLSISSLILDTTEPIKMRTLKCKMLACK